MNNPTPSASFEEQLARLDDIASLLERGTLPLADLLQLYEEGMHLTAQCRHFLHAAEQTVTEIQQHCSQLDLAAPAATDSEIETDANFELDF